MPRAVPAGAPVAVALFNDEADAADAGGLAVAQAQRRLLRRAGAVLRHVSSHAEWHHLAALTLDRSITAALASQDLRRVFADVDAVVVNGGEALFRRQGWHLFAILGAAQRSGLPTYLTNASLQDVDPAQPVLAGLADCVVRDARSARYLTRLGVAHRFVPDALFEAPFDQTPVHDFRAHLVVTEGAADQGVARAAVAAELGAAWLGPITAYSLTGTERIFDWAHAVADLRTAAAVVTGHFHGACLALAAGVPFVTVPSPTWDLQGLLDALDGYPADAADPLRPLSDRLDAVLAHRAWFREQAERVRELRPLETYRRLVPGLAPMSASPDGEVASSDAVDAVTAETPVGASVLHLGAGQGHVVDALVERGFRAWGADAAWRLARPDRTRYSSALPTKLPFADHVFATVLVSADWLQHLDLLELPAALAELARVARDRVVIEVTADRHPVGLVDGVGRGVAWWRERLAADGFEIEAGVEADDDTASARAFLVAGTPATPCPGCGRVHGPDHADDHGPYPVLPGALVAAARAAEQGRRQ